MELLRKKNLPNGQARLAPGIGRESGFTLLEVMVALTVIALGLAAVLSATSANVNNLAGLQARTFAHWVAMNQLAKVQLNGNRVPSTRRGSTEMADHEWYWEIELKDTADQSGKLKFLDISVKINEDDENSIVTLRSMVTK